MVPVDIAYHSARRMLCVTWEDSSQVEYPVSYLRGWCPCAVCQGHGTVTRFIPPQDEDLEIRSMWAVGSYAIGIAFSDGHSDGIYRWTWLEKLAPRSGRWRHGRFVHGAYIETPQG